VISIFNFSFLLQDSFYFPQEIAQFLRSLAPLLQLQYEPEKEYLKEFQYSLDYLTEFLNLLELFNHSDISPYFSKFLSLFPLSFILSRKLFLFFSFLEQTLPRNSDHFEKPIFGKPTSLPRGDPCHKIPCLRSPGLLYSKCLFFVYLCPISLLDHL